jgi:NAD(P)-dependent dehydrogenase (short-subunit alcohol dehydrogenase family)
MRNNIEGKVVVITGASSGLGEASARLLSAEGASVVLGARRHDRIQSLGLSLNLWHAFEFRYPRQPTFCPDLSSRPTKRLPLAQRTKA